MTSTVFLTSKKPGHHFEHYVYKKLENIFDNAEIIIQQPLASGKIPDFIIKKEQKIFVIDAKAKQKIGRRDIDQIVSYIKELDADFGKIFVADFTEIPLSVENYASLNAIEIEYTNWR